MVVVTRQMIACDNPDCPYQWVSVVIHWKDIIITGTCAVREEPAYFPYRRMTMTFLNVD